MFSTVNQNLCLVILTASLILPLGAQEKIRVRFAAQVLPPDIRQLVMSSGELVSEPFEIATEYFSKVQTAPARSFGLRTGPAQKDLIQVKLPAEGGRFIVLLAVSNNEKLDAVVIPDNRNAFRAGDVYVHNCTRKTVMGLLGASRFQLSPNAGRSVRPAGIVDGQYYEVRFATREDDDQTRMFSSTRWPAGAGERCYAFFYMDPRNPGRVRYRVISEVLLREDETG